MTREHAKELLPIITAYAEGKKIEIWSGYHQEKAWRECPRPSFDEDCKCRIAPEPDPYAELKAAKERGDRVQYETQDGKLWETDGSWAFPPERYRVKPAPKLVPMTSEDLPPVVWVRRKNAQDFELQVLAFHRDDGSFWTGEDPSFQHKPSTFDQWEWSPDRKTWASMMKEVEA